MGSAVRSFTRTARPTERGLPTNRLPTESEYDSVTFMRMRRRLTTGFGMMVIPIVCCAVTFYFGYSGIFGERGLIALNEIAAAGRGLQGLMLGVNDLAKALGTGVSPDREPFKPWLAALVVAARAHGLLAVDGEIGRAHV